jgi:ribosomal-protein-alanine N-acetyltransferase
MNEVFIEDMRGGHLPGIMEIERSSFSTPWSEISFLREMHSPLAISKAAVSEGRVIGYACAYFVGEEGHILNLAVREEQRRRGIGRMLAVRILEELGAKGCKTVFLEVRESNKAAKALYEGLGFRIISVRKAYYALPDEDAVIMRLSL